MRGSILMAAFMAGLRAPASASPCETEGAAVEYAHDFVELTLWAPDSSMVAQRREWGLVDSAAAQLVTDEQICLKVLTALREAGRSSGTRVAVLKMGSVYVARLPEDLAHDFVFDAALQLKVTFRGLG